MVFLGYNFFSNVNSLSTTPSRSGIIHAIRIFDGNYNHIFASKNTDLTLGNVGDPWDLDTILSTNFDTGSFDAGNSAFSVNNTDCLVIKRRPAGEFKWTVIYVNENISSTEDFKIVFTDKYARSGVEYEYGNTKEKVDSEKILIIIKITL